MQRAWIWPAVWPRKSFRINSDLDLAGRLAPLRTLIELYGGQQVKVFEVVMDGVADKRGVNIWPERWKEITAPAKKEKRKGAGEG